MIILTLDNSIYLTMTKGSRRVWTSSPDAPLVWSCPCIPNPPTGVMRLINFLFLNPFFHTIYGLSFCKNSFSWYWKIVPLVYLHSDLCIHVMTCHIYTHFTFAMLREVLSILQMETEFVKMSGDPGECIVHKAKEAEAELIVTGCRGLGTIRRTILGSVSDYIIHHSDVPVFVCRH
jgi:hypothetical protein